MLLCPRSDLMYPQGNTCVYVRTPPHVGVHMPTLCVVSEFFDFLRDRVKDTSGHPQLASDHKSRHSNSSLKVIMLGALVFLSKLPF